MGKADITYFANSASRILEVEVFGQVVSSLDRASDQVKSYGFCPFVCCTKVENFRCRFWGGIGKYRWILSRGVPQINISSQLSNDATLTAELVVELPCSEAEICWEEIHHGTQIKVALKELKVTMRTRVPL